jgi:hypothetical protein
VPPPGLSGADETPLQANVAAAWRDSLKAGLRYWERLGRLALEGAAALVPVVAELRPEAAAPTAESAAEPAAEAGLGRTILVEGELGQAGLGVFLLENTTAQQLSIPVRVSPFVGEDGREVHPAVSFRPDVITLDPGEQLIVQVVAVIDETLEPNVRYRAEISVPELSETCIPIVVRRRPSAMPRAPLHRNGRTPGRPKGQAKAETRDS